MVLLVDVEQGASIELCLRNFSTSVGGWPWNLGGTTMNFCLEVNEEMKLQNVTRLKFLFVMSFYGFYQPQLHLLVVGDECNFL